MSDDADSAATTLGALIADADPKIRAAMDHALSLGAKIAPGVKPLETPAATGGSLPSVIREQLIRLAALVDYLQKLDGAV